MGTMIVRSCWERVRLKGLLGAEPPVWPKTPPQLTPEQVKAREAFMMLWHEVLPRKYGILERFDHGSIARLPVRMGSKTLEVGSGLGEHSTYEDHFRQEYHCMDYREEFCKVLRTRMPAERVHCANIEKKQAAWEDASFDRVVAVHVLEHLRDLPAALNEICRLLRPDGCFDVVLPCEGGLLYSLASKISAERLFKKNFKMDYRPIRQNEHVSTFADVLYTLDDYFTVEYQNFFPFKLRAHHLNVVAAYRLRKRRNSATDN